MPIDCSWNLGNTMSSSINRSMTTTSHLVAPLTGEDLLAKLQELGELSKSELCRKCGYVYTDRREDGTERLAFTDFFTAILDAKGETLDVKEVETFKAEDEDNQEIIDDLISSYGMGPVNTFIELYGEVEIENFQESYRGEFSDGAEFAEFWINESESFNLPDYIEIDWNATWENLEDNHTLEGGYVFRDDLF